MSAPDRSYRVLIVDDEPLARRAVIRHASELLPTATIVEAKDGFEALEQMRALSPDIVFLDVEMPELSGLDVLRQLETPRPRVVFVTAHEHFAVPAFEANACDFLVKPFTKERFAKAVSRSLAELDVQDKLVRLEHALGHRGDHLARLALRRGVNVDVVDIADVVCFVSKQHYTYVYAGGREYMTELSLAHLEERLDPKRFARAHRSALVNLARIVRVVDADDTTLVLDQGIEVPLSRRNKRPLLDSYRDLSSLPPGPSGRRS